MASFPVKPGEQLMLVTDQGKMIRTTVGDIRIMGRNTQGVTIFKVAENEKVVSVAKIDESEEEEIETRRRRRARARRRRGGRRGSCVRRTRTAQ